MGSLDTAKVVNIAVISDGQVLVVRRAASDSLPGVWEIPGGAVEPGESFAYAARRELKEETGIQAGRPIELLRLVGPAPPGFTRPKVEAGLFRLALDPRPAVKLEHEEHSDYRWVAPEGLRRLEMMDINRSLAIIAHGSLRSKG